MDIAEKIREKKIKGYLTVNKRIIYEGAIYHVTQRAPGKELLFIEEGDYLRFLYLLKNASQKFSLDIFCFALLSNHLHILLRINQENLSEAMKNVFERYADYFNVKYKRKGHVFSGRYRASLCNDDNYLLAASIYIHLNPYRAGLCKYFEDYRWSSIDLYLTKHEKNTFVKFSEILLALNNSIDEARKEYRKLLEEGTKIKSSKVLDFFSIKRIIRETVRHVKKITGKDSENLDRLIDDIKTKKRVVSSQDKKARKYLIEQLLANGYSVEEIGDTLFMSRASFYRIMKQNKSDLFCLLGKG